MDQKKQNSANFILNLAAELETRPTHRQLLIETINTHLQVLLAPDAPAAAPAGVPEGAVPVTAALPEPVNE